MGVWRRATYQLMRGAAAARVAAQQLGRRRLLREGAAKADTDIAVVMTAFNSAAFIAPAVTSVLAQTHANLRLYIIDDASDDGTVETLEAMARRDSRISLYRSPVNHGTYWSKNWILGRVQAPVVAFHDSDDISRPERLQLQLGALARPDCAACTVRWQRYDGRRGPLVVDGRLARLAAISLMIKRAAVLDTVGYFDCVRIAADTEYMERIMRILGSKALCRLPYVAYEGQIRAGSLTTAQGSGMDWVADSAFIRRSLQGPRAAYLAAARRWHAEGKASRVPENALERPFGAPEELTVAARADDADRVEWIAGEKLP